MKGTETVYTKTSKNSTRKRRILKNKSETGIGVLYKRNTKFLVMLLIDKIITNEYTLNERVHKRRAYAENH